MRKKQVKEFIWNNRRRIKLLFFIVYCFFIVCYTLLARKQGAYHKADMRFMWAYREMLLGHPKWKTDVLQNIFNILFFVPFGISFPQIMAKRLTSLFRGGEWLAVMVCGLVFSTFIEITQYAARLGLCELDDVICNSLGALAGYELLRAIISFSDKHRKK